MDLTQCIRRIRGDGWAPVLEDENPTENGYGLYKKGNIQAHLVKMEIEGNPKYVLQRKFDPDAKKYRVYKGRLTSKQVDEFKEKVFW